MSSSPSCWESIASAVLPANPTSREAALREQLLEREEAAASQRAAVQRLTERADALQRRIDDVFRETAAAQAAASSAERRQREAEDQRRVAVRTYEMHEEKLRVLAKELKVKEGRFRVLDAILTTVRSRNRPVSRNRAQ
ncbi:hypothetical protein CFC21_046664 [Triticum aestivum]|uniref:Oberon coiled-coil region domain-containing protein n=2 Tax=Triticum aestivum TaxID=4565 RepID=A0A9R1FW16_WHEAT|nr:hypothetical protein CFC21_046664 [Triticum aestivum]